MVPIDPVGIRQLLEAAIAGFSVLGGGMAFLTGSYAARALAQDRPAAIVAARVNEGIGQGFTWSRWLSLIALIIMSWP